MRAICGMFIMAGVLGMATAARAADSDVAADVVANVSQVKQGQGFLVGLRLKTHEGWHVYWKNSGDAGIATDVKWSVTPGWEVQPLEMPVPQRFVATGDLVSDGYSGEVMLLARLVPTKTVAAVSEVTVTADATWLCCKEACVPGSKKVSVTVAVGGEGKAVEEGLFAKWEAAVPADAPPAAFTLKGTSTPGEKKGDAKVRLDITGPNLLPLPPAHNDLEIYPASDKVQILDGSILYIGHGNGSGQTGNFTVHMMASQKDPAHVPFLVSYEDHGERRGFFVNVDLSAASSGK